MKLTDYGKWSVIWDGEDHPVIWHRGHLAKSAAPVQNYCSTFNISSQYIVLWHYTHAVFVS